MSVCYCSFGWHLECDECSEDSPCHLGEETLLPALPAQRGGPIKNDEDVSDPKSTGRKRAVLVKPISEGDICEWAGLKYAGGGVHPIIGCAGNNATNVHHGPDKNTLNNDIENLHKVCSFCHNRWHVANDKTYPPDIPGLTWLPDPSMGECKKHDPDTRAELEDILKNEVKWRVK